MKLGGVIKVLKQKKVQGKRVTWVDYARGLAIFTVVLWHVAGGIFHSTIVMPDALEYIILGWDVYGLRLMPLFFVISGAFVQSSLDKGLGRFFKNKVRNLLYPYIIWSLIMLFLGTFMASYTNHGLTLLDWPKMLYDPVMHYWFLYALLVIMTVYAGFYLLKLSGLLFFAIGVVLYVVGELTAVVTMSYIAGQLCYFTIFFAFGVLIRERGLQYLDGMKGRDLVLLSVLSGGFFWGVFIIDTELVFSQFLRPLTSIALVASTVSLAVILDRRKVMTVVRYWGKLSLEIYLTHVLFLAAVRIILNQFLGVDDWVLHLIAGTFIGLYAPIVMVRVLKFLRFPYLFTWPPPKYDKTPTKPQIDPEERMSLIQKAADAKLQP